MNILQQMHYKQKSPEETVEKLKGILDEMGVSVSEEWQEESSIGTFALRVNFSGTKIGTNGKGVNEKYARASAYAEFFERYQNDILGPRVSFGERFPFLVAPDESIRTASEIVRDDNAFIRLYFKMRGMEESDYSKKTMAFSAVQKVDLLVYGLEDKYITLPFYSVRDNRITYLPKSTYTPFYGSNGMCAGNSPEEALVQGLAEIIERVVQKKLFIEKPTLPDVPDEYLMKFPYVYEIITKLKEQEQQGYRFWIKDCSFGGRYPVAALIVCELNSGKYGIKLGCHPDFGVAIERTLTEATQGQDIAEYAGRSTVDFANFHVDDWKNIYNSYKFGMGQYPYQIFGDTPTYPFTPVKDVSNLDNASILKEWVSQIISDGYDILIRDVSHLGFPSYHIIIPGLSEMVYPDDMKYRATNSRYYISHLLRDAPEEIDRANSKLIIATMDYFLGNAYENTMESYYGIVNPNDIPCENIHCGCAYMIAMCHAMTEEYQSASAKMQLVLKLADRGIEEGKITTDDYAVLLAIKLYFDARNASLTHEEALHYINTLFANNIRNIVDDLFCDVSKVISKQYPGVEKDGISNRIRYSDLYDSVSQYTFALRKKQMNCSINQMDLKRLFQH